MTQPSKLAAGNWKMNGTRAQLDEARALIAQHPDPRVGMALCPPATLLSAMAEIAAGSALKLGGQDCHAQTKGAHTGDVSGAMLAEAGAQYVILGHSERRTDHGESSTDVRAKIESAWAAGLTAILCLGETEAQRDAGETLATIKGQLAHSLPGGATADNTVIAYEPIWAIGTGRTPTLEQIAEVHGVLRGAAPDPAMSLLYGGSVNPSNAVEIFGVPNVDGGLVGGASLKASDFSQIVSALEASA